MARCLDLEDYEVRLDGSRCAVTLEAWDTEAVSWFVRIVRDAFPECGFRRRTGEREGGLLGLQRSVTLVGDVPSEGEAQLREFLAVIAGCLTIDDSLDESHALDYHQVEDATTGNLTRTVIGRLVNQAKYRTLRAPRERIGSALAGFIRAHPRYAHADAIAYMPPHTAGTRGGLSRRLVSQLIETRSHGQVVIERVRTRIAQKEISDEVRRVGIQRRMANQRNSMKVDGALTGASVIVVDDLYGSGASMAEAARALRDAGATTVLGLCATKQRLFGGVSAAR